MNQRQSVPCSTWYVNDRRWEINISILNLPFQQRFLGQPGHIRTFRSKKKLQKTVRETQLITHLKLPTIKTKTRKTCIFYYSSIYFVGVLVHRWQPENNFWEQDLSLHLLSWGQSKVFKLGCKHLLQVKHYQPHERFFRRENDIKKQRQVTLETEI